LEIKFTGLCNKGFELTYLIVSNGLHKKHAVAGVGTLELSQDILEKRVNQRTYVKMAGSWKISDTTLFQKY